MSVKKPFLSKEIESILSSKNQGIKLDLACGASKQGPDWVGIDIHPYKGVDIVQDLEKYPWPLPDNSCSVIVGSHIAEHINPAQFGFINWLNEIWRIMKPDGQLLLAMPYGGSPGFWQDPTHCNGCNEITWHYFDPLSVTDLYRFYKPKPWKIDNIFWSPEGNLEVKLIKRRENKRYVK